MQEKRTFLENLLALVRLPKLGPVKIKEILKISAQQCGQRDIRDMLDNAFASNDDCLVHPGKADWAGVEKDLAWAESKNNHILTFYDNHYPVLLKESHAAPPILFVTGSTELLSSPQLAMVGSRNPTPAGRETATRFARSFSECHVCVTSGLASGIDGASHRGALLAKGKTIAVLANGLDTIYPNSHQSLAFEIAEQGALVSEFPVGVAPTPAHFPRRNRIISGLSIGTLVVEATLKSGSLITANYAIEQGREVFAIPGSIYSSQSQGCHALIRQGAKLVERPQDVLEDLGSLLKCLSQLAESGVSPSTQATRQTAGQRLMAPHADARLTGQTVKLDNAQRYLLSYIGYEPTAIETIIRQSGLTGTNVSTILLELELKTCIKSCLGGYARVVSTSNIEN